MEKEQKTEQIQQVVGEHPLPDTAPAPEAAPCIPKAEKKEAKKLFDWVTYFGFGGVLNSTISLFITYNVLPTEIGIKTKATLGKMIAPAVEVYQRAKHSVFGNKAAKKLTEDFVHEQARSTAEVMCMVVAGFTVLPIMKWLEDHKGEVVNKFDRFIHRKKYSAMSEQQVAEAQNDGVEYEKQSWPQLMKSRIVGLTAVFTLDGLMQSWNTSRFAARKENFDTLEWKAGGKAFEKLPKSLSEKMISFFSRKGQGIETIQPQVRDRIANLVGHDAKKMVFAEQTRLLSKELSLTALCAAIVWMLAKTTGKTTKDKVENNAAPLPTQPASYPEETNKDDKTTNYSTRFKENESPKKKPIPKNTLSFAEAISNLATDQGRQAAL